MHCLTNEGLDMFILKIAYYLTPTQRSPLSFVQTVRRGMT